MADLWLKDLLKKYMEVQEWCKTPGLVNPPRSCPEKTAPDYCLLASRFMVAKLSGLLPLAKHFDDFLASDVAKRLARREGHGNLNIGVATVDYVSGHLSTLETFNREILPAAIDWADSIGFGKLTGKVKFVQFWGQGLRADSLLRHRVALVVGVDIHNNGGCNHTNLRSR